MRIRTHTLRRQLMFFVLLLLPALLSARNWQDKEGRSFEGEMISYDAEYVRIERKGDRMQFKIERSKLSDGDNLYIDEVARKKRIDELLKDIPDTYNKAYDLTIKKSMPAIIFYRNQMSYGEFDALLEKLVAQPKFQEKIKDRVFLVVIREKDVDLEGSQGDFAAYTDRPRMTVIQEYKAYSAGAFRDMELDAFLEEVETAIRKAETSLY